MATLTMLSYKLQDLQFFNKLEQAGQIQLENNFSFSVNYNQDNSRCMAKLYQCVKDKSDSPDHRFFISVEIAGIFEVDGEIDDEDKKAFHVQCYQQLFPYAEMIAKQTCASGGMPNFILLRQKMDKDNVVINRAEDR